MRWSLPCSRGQVWTQITSRITALYNLSFVSKLLERHVAVDLRRYIDENPFQSVYHPHHSTKTAPVRIHDDIMQASSLILLTLTLWTTLKQMKSIGICESALAWIASYLSDRSLAVKIEDAISRRQQLNYGGHQGSVLGPLLFTIYCMPLTAIFTRHHLKYHDTQLYVNFPRNQPCDADIATRRIEACATDMKLWMTSHQLLLNETKTKTIVFYGRNARVPPATTTVDVCGCHIMPQPTVRDIGIFLDSGMDISMQVARTCQAAYFQLHNIAKRPHCLTIDVCKTIVHGLVTSKLDYGNAVLCGISVDDCCRNCRVQNSAVRVITPQRRRDHLHITPVLTALHWLPVPWRITYKILVLTFRAVYDLASVTQAL